MPLVNCPDCDKQVSSNAPTCPNCGAPIATALAAQPESPSAPQVQTIEKTSKAWKALQLAGIVIWVGSCVAYFGDDRDTSVSADYWAPWILGGIALFVFAKVMAWWRHG